MNTQTRAMPADVAVDGPSGLLKITWKDGHRSEIPLPEVRKRCPCAGCNEERARPADPFRILTPAQLGTGKVESAELVGNYAMKIRWRDGHDSGIFSWDFLRRMCPCAECAPARA